jgi:hypothetical protein
MIETVRTANANNVPMRYVERDSGGQIIAHYNRPQPGRAEELIAIDHEDFLFFEELLEIKKGNSIFSIHPTIMGITSNADQANT